MSCTPSSAFRIRLRWGWVRDSSSVIRPSSIRLWTKVWSWVTWRISPSAEQVGAAVTDVAEGEPLAVEQRDGDRGAGAAEARVVVDDLGDPVVGPVQGARDGAAQVGVSAGGVELAQLADGGAGGQVAAGGPAHAVADGDHPRAGVAGVLVVLADPADVGDRGVAQTERHRLLPQLDHRLADPHLRAERERGRLGDPDGPDVGAVGRAEVLDEPLVAATRRSGRAGWRRSRRRAGSRRPVRGRSGSGRRSSSARSPWLSPSTTSTWVGAPRRALAGLGGRGLRWAAACAGALRDPGAEHVGADHRQRRQHEDPQDRQVGEPDQEQGQLRHRRSPRWPRR